MLWGQQNVIVSEKQLSDLSLMTNEALKQKVQTMQLVVHVLGLWELCSNILSLFYSEFLLKSLHYVLYMLMVL